MRTFARAARTQDRPGDELDSGLVRPEAIVERDKLRARETLVSPPTSAASSVRRVLKIVSDPDACASGLFAGIGGGFPSSGRGGAASQEI